MPPSTPLRDARRLTAAGVAITLALAATPLHARAADTTAPTAEPDERAARLLAQAGELQQRLWKLQAQSKLIAAYDLAKRIAELKAQALGPEHPDLVAALHSQAGLSATLGDSKLTLELYERILRIQEKLHGPESEEVASVLDAVAVQRWLRQEWAEGEPLLLRALAIREKLYPPGDPRLANAYRILAGHYQTKRDYGRSEALYRKAWDLQVATDGEDSPQLDGLVLSLAWLYVMRRDKRQAAPWLERALANSTKPGRYAPGAATMADSVAVGFMRLGMKDRAEEVYAAGEELHLANLKAATEANGEASLQAATALRSLGQHYMGRGRPGDAATYLARALKVDEALYGKTSLSVSGDHTLLGMALEKAKRFREAERAYKRAYDLLRKAWGPDQAAGSLALMAGCDEALGKYGRAVRRYDELIGSYTRRFGSRTPWAAYFMLTQGRIHWRMGKPDEALERLLAGQAVLEPYLGLLLSTGSEQDKRAFLAENAYQLDLYVSFHRRAMPGDAAAGRLAMSTLLQRKGRVLDAMTDTLAALRRRMKPEDRELIEELASARSQLAKHVTKGAQSQEPELYGKRLAELEDRVRELEMALSSRSAEFRAQATPVTLEAVQRAIPEDAALVELLSYADMKADDREVDLATMPRRYAAYVMTSDTDVAASAGRGEGPVAIDLGDARAIDQLVPRLRKALASPRGTDVKRLARELDRLVMEPVRGALGGRRRVLVAPDGALNLVPFGALVDEGGHYLVQRFTFTYLTSGRDLLRFAVQIPPKTTPFVVAAPAFDGPERGEAADTAPDGARRATRPAAEMAFDMTRGTRSLDLRAMRWGALPGTAGEAEALELLMPNATVLTGAAATETALKGVAAPRILHVATHGFFLPDTPLTAGADGGRGAGGPAAPPENPLLRSGLALAGANLLESGDDDGVLTALEASGLDLWGTGVVVLSACETGLGEISNGEGVYGLRRALVLAGSESQLFSLWQVDDDATRDLMVGYYKALLAGRGRTDALRTMQLKLLRSADYQHPYYWASFVPAGQWTPLSE